jgi:hypothetical protein
MPCSSSRARSCYAGELSSLPPLRSAASVRISSSILATRGGRRGGPLGMTTRGPQTEPGTGRLAGRPSGCTRGGGGSDFRVADGSGLTHGSGPPAGPRQRAEGASPIPPPRLPVPRTRESTSSNPPGGGRWSWSPETLRSSRRRRFSSSRPGPLTGSPKRAPPPDLVRPRPPRGTGVVIPTTGNVESESLDAESRLRAQTT